MAIGSILQLLASTIQSVERDLKEVGGQATARGQRFFIKEKQRRSALGSMVRLMWRADAAAAMDRAQSAPPKERKQLMTDVIEHFRLFNKDPLVSNDWPVLTDLGLGKDRRERRREGIGGSDANIILSGDPDRLVSLWQEKRGEQPEVDLSANLAVMLGCWTEDFNRQWYENVSGRRVDQVQLSLTCRENDWRRCNLDGFLLDPDSVWEAKHTNAFAKSEEVLARYMPQMQHNMAVARCGQAILSVIFGNHKFEIFEVASDWVYQIELLQAELDFWECVQTGRRPVPAAPPAPPKPIGIREICLDGNNAWASAAADWIECRHAAKRHATAVGQIKELVEADVGRAFGHGIEARRSKAGAISIKELQQ